jgi:hypothetical protein
VTYVVVVDKVEVLKNEKMGPPGPCSSRSGSWYSMSRTCGPQDIISLVIPKLGDNKRVFQLCAPITDLTRKEAFDWNDEAQSTFEKMKEVMSTCPVLSLLNFSQPFILECDASGEGVGPMLMQNSHNK